MVRAGFLFVLLAVASLRCGGGDAAHDAIEPTDAVSDEAAGVDAAEVHDAVLDAPAMPIPVCGLTSHAWLPFEGMGEVIAVEALPQYSYKKEMLDATDDCTIDVEELGVSALSDVFHPGFVAAVQAGTWEGFEDWRCVLAENSLPTTSVPRANDAPMFPLLSGNDELVNIAAERAAHVVMC